MEAQAHLVNTLTGLIIIYLGGAIFCYFLIVGYMRSLPFHLIEATRIDGAGPLRILQQHRAPAHPPHPHHRCGVPDNGHLERLHERKCVPVQFQPAHDCPAGLQRRGPILHRLAKLHDDYRSGAPAVSAPTCTTKTRGNALHRNKCEFNYQSWSSIIIIKLWHTTGFSAYQQSVVFHSRRAHRHGVWPYG